MELAALRLMMPMLLIVVATAAPRQQTMRALRTTGACKTPFPCVNIAEVAVPELSEGEVLIRINATSVNPSDVDTVEAGGCQNGCGADVAGTVVACSNCKRLAKGDHVWTLASGAYAEYITTPESHVGLKPKSIDAVSAATLPEVSLTSYLSLKRTGSNPGAPLPTSSPWSRDTYPNLTVAITAGGGGTGFAGIQLAKAWGAKHIATSTTGADGFAFVKALGATFVTDYHTEDLFDALADNSVDIVYDNYGAEGTADRAMRAIRPGGMYLLMPHGECYEKKIQGPPCLSAKPKAGVRQLNYVTGPDFQEHILQGLDELKGLVEAGKLVPHIDKTFELNKAAEAFAYSAGPGEGGVGHHFGKISISVGQADGSSQFTNELHV